MGNTQHPGDASRPAAGTSTTPPRTTQAKTTGWARVSPSAMSDPRLRILSWRQRYAFIYLMTCAWRGADRNGRRQDGEVIRSPLEIATALGIDVANARRDIRAMIDAGLLCREDDRLIITGFADWCCGTPAQVPGSAADAPGQNDLSHGSKQPAAQVRTTCPAGQNNLPDRARAQECQGLLRPSDTTRICQSPSTTSDPKSKVGAGSVETLPAAAPGNDKPVATHVGGFASDSRPATGNGSLEGAGGPDQSELDEMCRGLSWIPAVQEWREESESGLSDDDEDGERGFGSEAAVGVDPDVDISPGTDVGTCSASDDEDDDGEWSGLGTLIIPPHVRDHTAPDRAWSKDESPRSDQATQRTNAGRRRTTRDAGSAVQTLGDRFPQATSICAELKAECSAYGGPRRGSEAKLAEMLRGIGMVDEWVRRCINRRGTTSRELVEVMDGLLREDASTVKDPPRLFSSRLRDHSPHAQHREHEAARGSSSGDWRF